MERMLKLDLKRLREECWCSSGSAFRDRFVAAIQQPDLLDRAAKTSGIRFIRAIREWIGGMIYQPKLTTTTRAPNRRGFRIPRMERMLKPVIGRVREPQF